jgi:dipeptidyl aminopeptidase/acylaminoacyl peptidase
MIGYQADLGPDYWGALYDESRRDKVLIAPDTNLIKKILKVKDWNDYEIIANKNRIQIKINNIKTVDYYELDPAIPQSGLIGLQVHGGGKTRVGFKDIYISDLK